MTESTRYGRAVGSEQELVAYLEQLRPVGVGWGATAVVAAVARRLAEQSGALSSAQFAALRLAALPVQADLVPVVPDSLVRPDLLGWVYEALLDGGDRHARGAYFTPPPIAAGMVELALCELGWDRDQDTGLAGGSAPTICDPALGGGAFLLAAARAMELRGLTRTQIVRDLLWGIDIDSGAVATAEAALGLWSGAVLPQTAAHLLVADALEVGLDSWPKAPAPFAAVVGNPPFQNQLGRGTARSRRDAERLVKRFGAAAKGYVDTAALFLLVGCDLVTPEGVVALIQPQSVLAAHQTGPARSAVATRGAVMGLWWSSEAAFEASVRVCGIVLRAGSEPAEVKRYLGAEFSAAGSVNMVEGPDRSLPATWGHLLAGIGNRPDVHITGEGTLGGWCTATAGFRDQFYGLVPHTVDRPDGLGPEERALITTALIDPLHCRWGERRVRFAGVHWQAPAVDLDSLREDPKLHRWVLERLVPKVLVATQSRVIEIIVDEQGVLIPSVPVIAVQAAPGRLWHLAAALLSPALSADALVRHAGTALSEDAIKLSARAVLGLPSPRPGAAWDHAARALAHGGNSPSERARALHEAAGAMGLAYRGIGDNEGLRRWWEARWPKSST